MMINHSNSDSIISMPASSLPITNIYCNNNKRQLLQKKTNGCSNNSLSSIMISVSETGAKNIIVAVSITLRSYYDCWGVLLLTTTILHPPYTNWNKNPSFLLLAIYKISFVPPQQSHPTKKEELKLPTFPRMIQHPNKIVAVAKSHGKHHHRN